MNRGAAAEARDPERGVFEAPCRVGGCDALVAIDARGDVCKVAKLRPGCDYATVRAALQAELDRIDPLPPRPQLVRDVPPRPAQRQVHPAHTNDYPAYRRRLIQQISRRVHVFRD